jgi:hypothetical protein
MHLRQLLPHTIAAAAVFAATAWGAGSLPSDRRLTPAGPPPAGIIHAVDIHAAPDDTKLAAVTLQGIVNREGKSRVWLDCFDPEAKPGRFWLEELKRKGYIRQIETIGIPAYFGKYASFAEGAVIYDPALPATINIASMLAALENRIVLPPGGIGMVNNITDSMDLRGRWKTNAEAYAWALRELFPRMRHDILASYHPARTKHHLRDYLVSQKIFTFWVTGQEDDKAAHADHRAEKALAEKIFAATPPNIPVIGWWDAGEAGHGMSEYGGVGWAGSRGKITLGMDWMDNLSVLSGVPVDMKAVLNRFREREAALPEGEPEPGKVYISFVVMESGDAPAYWPHVQHQVWQNSGRGRIPVGWTITPVILDLLPSVGEWFLDNAGPRDHFIMALSGWG